MGYVGLLDCNNFFVSCERLFRPDLVRRPVLVLSSNDGCVVARSQEVKDMGIAMGMPYFQIRSACKRDTIAVFSSNFSLYRDISRRMMRVLEEEVGMVDQYSIDEAFFSVPDTWDMKQCADTRARIMQKTGIPVSLSLSSTKTRAKMGNLRAKRTDGVCILDDVLFAELAQETPCGSVWGIGRQLSHRLTRDGIHTVAEYSNQPLGSIRARYGVVGERIFHELVGIPASSPSSEYGHHKSYTRSASFKKSTYACEDLVRTAVLHAESVAEKIHRDDVCIGILRVFLSCRVTKQDEHVMRGRTHIFDAPTASITKIIRVVARFVEDMYEKDMQYGKVGVWCGDVSPRQYQSDTLFGTTIEEERSHTIDALRARIEEKFGTEYIGTARTARGARIVTQKSYISPAYTTSWTDVPKIRIG